MNTTAPATPALVSRTLPSRNEFDEEVYLQLHPDVFAAVFKGTVGSGWQHFSLYGFAEGRAWVPKRDPLTDLVAEIAPGDEMNLGNSAHYFDVGESALNCIEMALLTSRKPKSTVTRILDLPCGFGRVMRFLRKAFPDAHLTACDLHREGIEFCAKAFGADPVLSQVDVEAIPLHGGFDLIWCGSLLTHLPLEKCASFLQLFQRLLHPGGILVFTTHGRRCAIEIGSKRNPHGLSDLQISQLLAAYDRTGFGYVDYTGQSGYGLSLALPAFVMANLIRHPEWRLLGYNEMGWDGRQDAVCLQKLGNEVSLALPDGPWKPKV